MLNMAIRNTNKLVREVAAKDNLRIGRFFTKKAEAFHMASLFALPAKDELSLLDAGAGTGILSANEDGTRGFEMKLSTQLLCLSQ